MKWHFFLVRLFHVEHTTDTVLTSSSVMHKFVGTSRDGVEQRLFHNMPLIPLLFLDSEKPFVFCQRRHRVRTDSLVSVTPVKWTPSCHMASMWCRVCTTSAFGEMTGVNPFGKSALLCRSRLYESMWNNPAVFSFYFIYLRHLFPLF